MGAASVLGSVAAGYAQAAQLDQQRQFETEQNRRTQIGGFLQKLAQDETAHPHTRQAAATEFINLQHQPWNKSYKFNPDVLIAPATPGQTQTAPTAPPGMQPGLSPNLSREAAAASQPVPGWHPPMALPTPIPPPAGGGPMLGSQPSVPTLGASAQYTPVEPPGLFKSPELQTQEAVSRVSAVTHAQAAAQTEAQLHARQAALQQIMQANPEMSPMEAASQLAVLEGRGFPMAMMGTSGAGDKMPASVAREAGVPIPDGTPDEQWVHVNRNKMGQIVSVVPTAPPVGAMVRESTSTVSDPVTGLPTTTKSESKRVMPGVPTPPPGSGLPAPKTSAPTKTSATSPTTTAPAGDNVIAGRKVNPTYANQIASLARTEERNGQPAPAKLAPDVQAYMAEHGMVSHTTQQVADYQKAFDLAMGEDRRFKVMHDIVKDIQKTPSPANLGSLDAALIAYHMGMTVGQVKGMRSGKDLIQFHTAARSLPEDMQVAFEHWVNGADLSNEQRQNFVNLAETSRASTWQQAVSQARGMGFSRFPDPTPGLPPLQLWTGTMTGKQISSAAKDHGVSYGEVRKQAIAEGYRIDD